LRLLLDEHLSKAIARGLREQGHDAVGIDERPEWSGLADPEVMALALAEGRAIVTADAGDFRPLAAESILSGEGHPGLVLLPSAVRRTRGDVGRLIRALSRLLEQHAGDRELGNSEHWLEIQLD
jgi:predicted nuclease of predicted toxin-antitoxin system